MPDILRKLTFGMYLSLLIAKLLFSSDQVFQLQPLPSKIVFSATHGIEDENWKNIGLNLKYNVLGQIDPETLEIGYFYEDAEASLLKPLSWSSDGNLLAVLHVVSTEGGGSRSTICIITASGTLQSCLDDAPSETRSFTYDDFYGKSPITWSIDNKYIYFVAESKKDDQVSRRLIEADTMTGRTVNIIYQTKYYSLYDIPIISWTADLKYVAVGVAKEVSTEKVLATLVDIDSGKELELRVMDGKGMYFVCREFSPLGNYLLAVERESIDHSVKTTHLIVFDRQGAIVRKVDIEAYNTTQIQCPTWNTDENAFYFYLDTHSGLSRYILSYDFEQDNLTEYMSIDDFYIFAPVLPILTSHNKLYFTFGSFPITGMSTESTKGRQISVVYPDGEVLHLGAPFEQTQWPIWVPLDEGD